MNSPSYNLNNTYGKQMSMHLTTSAISYNLSGSVKNMGLAVANTRVCLYDYWLSESGNFRHLIAEHTTGPKGDFSFGVACGTYCLEVIPSDNTRLSRQLHENIIVTCNKNFDINVKPGYFLSGHILNKQGEKVKNCKLLISRAQDMSAFLVEEVDSTGNYKLSLAGGRYFLAVTSTLPQENEMAFLSTQIHSIKIAADTEYDIIVSPEILFEGVVKTADDSAVANALVRLTAKQSAAKEVAFSVEVLTDIDGCFKLNLPPGEYDLHIKAEAAHSLVSHKSTFFIEADQKNVYKLERGFIYKGQVIHDRQPIEGAYISIANQEINLSQHSDKDGNFTFCVPAGSYQLFVAPQIGSCATIDSSRLAPLVELLNVEKNTSAKFELQEGLSVSGAVLDQADNPRSGMQISLYKADNEEQDRASLSPVLASCTTAADGTYNFKALPGTYWLVMNNQARTAQFLEIKTEDLSQKLNWQKSCVLTFELTTDDDMPVPNCVINCAYYQANQKDEPGNITVLSNEQGICQITLPAGVYSFSFEPPDYAGLQARSIRQLSLVADLKRKIKLPANMGLG